MHVVHNDDELRKYVESTTNISGKMSFLISFIVLLNTILNSKGDHPVVITKFIEYAQEIELDAVALEGEVKQISSNFKLKTLQNKIRKK